MNGFIDHSGNLTNIMSLTVNNNKIIDQDSNIRANNIKCTSLSIADQLNAQSIISPNGVIDNITSSTITTNALCATENLVAHNIFLGDKKLIDSLRNISNIINITAFNADFNTLNINGKQLVDKNKNINANKLTINGTIVIDSSGFFVGDVYSNSKLVPNIKLSYLSDVTSNIQTQLNTTNNKNSALFLLLLKISQSSKLSGLTGIDLSNQNLIGLDLSGLNLSESNFSGANLSNSNLSDVNLSNTILIGAYLTGSNLSGVNLSGADLSGLNLSGLNLSGANLSGLNLDGLNLSDANLSGVNLSAVSLIAANLSGANLSDANLIGANLSSANLGGANLNGVVLSGSNLTGTNTTGISGTPAYVSSDVLSSGLRWNAYNGYFENSGFSYTVPVYGNAGQSSGTSTNFSNLSNSTGGNFVDNTNPSSFTIAYSGFIYAQIGGTYIFSCTSDDGSYLWIDKYNPITSNALINNGGGHGAITVSGSYKLTQGCYYKIKILYGNSSGGSTFAFSFKDPNGTTHSSNMAGWLYC